MFKELLVARSNENRQEEVRKLQNKIDDVQDKWRKIIEIKRKYERFVELSRKSLLKFLRPEGHEELFKYTKTG